jgi:hypothetical protein
MLSGGRCTKQFPYWAALSVGELGDWEKKIDQVSISPFEDGVSLSKNACTLHTLHT